MASCSGRKFLQRATSIFLPESNFSSRIIFQTRSVHTLKSPSPASRIFPRQNPFFSSRLPMELSCSTESLMPLHSVTASALLKSMLSSKVGQWGVLSEGFATPL